MPHWTSFHIERFRRLENLRLDGLGTVNLLVGKNNSGKTSVLETLAIACHPLSAFNWIDTARERELKSARTPALEVLNRILPHEVPRENGFEGAAAMQGILTGGDCLRINAAYREFRQENLQEEADPTGEEDPLPSNYAGQLKVQVTRAAPDGEIFWGDEVVDEFSGGKFSQQKEKEPLLPHQLVSPVSHRTSRQLLAAVDQILEDRMKGDVVGLMKMLADDVDDIEIRSPQGRGAVISLHHSQIGHVPLSVEGDGMRRALAFASASTLAKNGVLLLDEVETALHPAALSKIFRFLVGACRANGVQLFVSTHSLEAVDAMLASVGEALSDIVAFHLPSRDSSGSVYRLGGESIREMREDGGLDLR